MDMHNWIPDNINWIRSVATPLFKKWHMKLECYVDTVINDKCHIEEIALLIIAKMYNIHIGVLYHYDI